MKVSETASLVFFGDSSSVMYPGDTSVPETYNLYVVHVLLDMFIIYL